MTAFSPRAGGGERRGLLDAFAELASTPIQAAPPQETLLRVAVLARQTLPGVADVSVTLIEDSRPRTLVSTGGLALDLDTRQYELGSGPCLDAARTGRIVTVDNAASSSLYGDFSRDAYRAGVPYTLSVGMPITQPSLGGLNVYGTAEAAFAPDAVSSASVFARYAAVAVFRFRRYADAVDEAHRLRGVMAAEAVVEQAKGILMVRGRCSAPEALATLERLSRARGVDLHEIATTVVALSQQ